MRWVALACLCCGLTSLGYSQPIETITVTADRRPQNEATVPGALTIIDGAANQLIGARHPGEIVGQAAGVWVARGSGQEHLTAIRSPVLTGAGACGAFLYLEDGIPLRPAGFCNVNGLFEVNTEQAAAIEVWRGPAPTLYGSNGLHGLINVVSPNPAPGWAGSIEAWEDDYYRSTLSLGSRDGRRGLSALIAKDAGFRANSGTDQVKANAVWQPQLASGELQINLATSYLNQDTAGLLFGQDAYRDATLSTTNANPEAYRDAYAIRLYAVYSRSLDKLNIDIRPFLRHSKMEFLQHFLPGQPVEKNGQTSGGVSFFFSGNTREGLSGGVDLEIVSGFLEEFQAQPLTFGSPFLMATRPAGLHYDYDVAAYVVAPHLGFHLAVNDAWALDLGARLEWLRYDYDNRTLTGNTRDDGTACGFGGCLFNRPPDRQDNFVNFAPRISITRTIAPSSQVYLALGRGFRAPQATELYRLQRQQSVADLDSEQLDNIELGVKSGWETASLRVAAFRATKRHFIFRDADGFNVSDGRTRHVGIELSSELRLHPQLTTRLALTAARHTYQFDRPSAGIVTGLDVDTAPRTLGELNIIYRPTGRSWLSARWSHQSDYFLEPANTRSYPGHDLLDLRFGMEWDRWGLQLSIDNATDRRFADRADFAFGSFRYSPGQERRIGLRVTYAGSRAHSR